IFFQHLSKMLHFGRLAPFGGHVWLRLRRDPERTDVSSSGTRPRSRLQTQTSFSSANGLCTSRSVWLGPCRRCYGHLFGLQWLGSQGRPHNVLRQGETEIANFIAFSI